LIRDYRHLQTDLAVIKNFSRELSDGLELGDVKNEGTREDPVEYPGDREIFNLVCREKFVKAADKDRNVAIFMEGAKRIEKAIDDLGIFIASKRRTPAASVANIIEREEMIASDFADELLTKLVEAKAEGVKKNAPNPVVLAFDKSWIPEGLTASVVVATLRRLSTDLKNKKGLEFEFIEGEGDDLAATLKKMNDNGKGVKFSNMIVIGPDYIANPESMFARLADPSEKEFATLISVEMPEWSHSLTIIRLIEMYLLAMKLAGGKSPEGLDQTYIEIVKDASGRPNVFIFKPIKPHDTGEIPNFYHIQREEIDARA
jgi:hypothetical protein